MAVCIFMHLCLVSSLISNNKLYTAASQPDDVQSTLCAGSDGVKSGLAVR